MFKNLKITFLCVFCFLTGSKEVDAVVNFKNMPQQTVIEPVKPQKISFFQALKLRKEILKRHIQNNKNTHKQDLTTGLVLLGLALLGFILVFAVSYNNLIDEILYKMLFLGMSIVLLILGIVFLIRSIGSSSPKSKV